jgi:DNA-binding NtrC family response regulator
MPSLFDPLRRLFAPSREPARILLAEDDPSTSILLTKILSGRFPTAEIHAARKMEDALVFLRKDKFDLVVSDHHLIGHETGMDLWNLCRYYYPESKILVVSSKTENEIQELSHRMNELPKVYRKPIRSETFLRAVEDALGLA